ncbi:unnamed protein product [Sphagnum jensenii]|uniref:Uncharacterized protein n=1 Tax=Sphagnum jensenii TaxID=128206 RepID=A0ABP0VCQ6_9BRYO
MSQTANKPWLYEYTKRIEENGLAAANMWATEEVSAKRVPWCAPTASTYDYLRVIAQVNDETVPNGLKIEHFGLNPYSAGWWYNFTDTVGDKLDADQRLKMERIGRMIRNSSPNDWQGEETKRTAAGAKLYELPPPPPKV